MLGEITIAGYKPRRWITISESISNELCLNKIFNIWLFSPMYISRVEIAENARYMAEKCLHIKEGYAKKGAPSSSTYYPRRRTFLPGNSRICYPPVGSSGRLPFLLFSVAFAARVRSLARSLVRSFIRLLARPLTPAKEQYFPESRLALSHQFGVHHLSKL